MSSQASLCAADQNMFWPYHDRLFQAASTRGQAGVEIGQLTTFAREVGMDEARFSQCMNNQEHMPTMVASLGEAQQLQLNSTPSILVNGKLIANPFDYNSLMAEIEAATPAN
jgi:protein-disulfide isomerase